MSDHNNHAAKPVQFSLPAQRLAGDAGNPFAHQPVHYATALFSMKILLLRISANWEESNSPTIKNWESTRVKTQPETQLQRNRVQMRQLVVKECRKRAYDGALAVYYDDRKSLALQFHQPWNTSSTSKVIPNG